MISNKLTAIVVDDEPLAIEGLILRLDKIPEINVIGHTSNGDDAIKMCQELCPDVIFLDLKMPGLNGIEVVQSMQNDILPMVVFVSAHGEYALDAFELNAIDYVLKPANLGRLKKTVERILMRRDSSSTDKEKLLHALEKSSGISISELEEWLETDKPLPSAYQNELVIKTGDNQRIFLSVDKIRWIDAAGDYMCIHENKETHVVRITMKKLEGKLDPQIFTRIHKSTLVNVNYIKGMINQRNSECLIQLNEDVNLKVSRNYSAKIHALVKSKLL